MATTPIYGFVTPDLANTADGPAAMAALAQRVERQMTTLRQVSGYVWEPNAAYNADSLDNVIAQQVVPTVVIGWMTIYVNVNLAGPAGSISGSGSTFAGQLETVVDDVLIRQYRFHALAGTRTLALSTQVSAGRTAAQTSATIKIRLDLESGVPVNVNHINLRVEQFGAPASG